MNVHVIGPVIRKPSDDDLVQLKTQTIALSTIYEALQNDARFTAHIPSSDVLLDDATPDVLFAQMQEATSNADRVVWVYYDEPAGAIEAGLAIAAGKPLHLLGATADLPRIVKGIPNLVISNDVDVLCDDIATAKSTISVEGQAARALADERVER